MRKNTTAVVSHECSDNDVVTLICATGEGNHIIDSNAEWVVDSAASYHCVSKKYLSAYKAGNLGSIKMSNSSVANIVGLGDICIQTNLGCTVVLKNVRHILNFRLNLVSMSALDKEGYKHQLGEGT